MDRKLPTPDELNVLLRYDRETGLLFWRPRPATMFHSSGRADAWNARYSGNETFHYFDSNGYKVGTIWGVQIKAHRVIWAIVNGTWPDIQIDHINGARTDNRILNLREVTRQENLKNQKRRSSNKSGFTGVCFDKTKGKWTAYISNMGRIKLGSFDDIESAIKARTEANEKYGYHKNHGRET